MTDPTDLSTRAAALSARLGVSRTAAELTLDAHVIDLHIDTLIPPRLWGYDPLRAHGLGLLRGHFFGHLDVPRALDGGLSGAMWSITTNPFRGARARWAVFQRNVARLKTLLEQGSAHIGLARTPREYRQVVASGRHAVMPAVQGGNALEAAPGGLDAVEVDLLTRVTLVHLTNSVYGATSSPASWLRRDRGLSDAGRALIAQLNARRVFVDLAHIHPDAFWQAVQTHDRGLPLIATHTGVCGVRPHWRNLDDAQVRAIADSGGVVGVIFASAFLTRPGGPRGPECVVEHMEHVARVAGPAAVALGSDYDGAIIPPRALRDGVAYARLVDAMLRRGWSEAHIRGALGENFLAAFERLRTN
jgi:membrane dipeptidase